MTHNTLVETHNLLMVTFSDNNKRPCDDDREPVSELSNSLPLRAPTAPAEEGTIPFSYSRSDYPHINFWTKQEWKYFEDQKKDSSEVAGPRGGGRSARGENVMCGYIEDINGTPVSGTTVGDIREFARLIWRGFYDRGLTPETWGNISKEVRDHYVHEMETQWPVLRYCENHWKANKVATSIYSQWYHPYDKKMKELKAKNGPSTKKCRMTEEPGVASSPSEVQDDIAPAPTCETPPEDTTEPPPPGVATTSRPRARSLRNPL